MKIFNYKVENLLKIFNIFSSETVDLEVKQNASEQLAIMIATGDPKLHKAFLNLDGVNYCIRYLKQTVLQSTKPFLFLSRVEVKNLILRV